MHTGWSNVHIFQISTVFSGPGHSVGQYLQFASSVGHRGGTHVFKLGHVHPAHQYTHLHDGGPQV